MLRALHKFGISLRDKSSAQKEALASGRCKHPTRGKPRSEEEKKNIGEGVANAWKQTGEAEKSRRTLLAKDNWEETPEEKKQVFFKLANEAMRAAAKDGSRLERYLLLGLQRHGVAVEFHKEYFFVREQLQTDLFLPEHNVVIEIDGPSHFFPIWGEESLARHLQADAAKTGLIMQAGYTLIRVKHIKKSCSKNSCEEVLTKILNVIHSISENKQERYIEVET